MSYTGIAQMAGDAFLRERITACAADEGALAPEEWSNDHRWQVVVAPGWAEAWESAVAGEVENPGADPGVITDAMILSQVQLVLADTEP